MAFIIEDHFYEASPPVTLASHTPLDGGSWASNTVWGVTGFYMEAATIVYGGSLGSRTVGTSTTSATSPAYQHSASPGTTNLEVNLTIVVADYTGVSFWGSCRVAIRASDSPQNGLQFGYSSDAGGGGYGAHVIKWKNGTPTILFEDNSGMSNNAEVKLRFTAVGDTFTLHRDINGAGETQIWSDDVTDVTWGDEFITSCAGNVLNRIDYMSVEFATSPPVKPTIAIAAQGPDFIEYSSSAFSPGVPLYGQSAAQWQVTLAADTGFATPARDVTTYNEDTFEAYQASGLNLFLNQYIGRVRHADWYDGAIRWSAWSIASANSSIETEGQYYTAFAERPIGVNIRTDVPADWSELDTSDGESTWFLNARDDATCLVTMDRVSLDGVAGTVDPILWEGFPSIAEQVVFGRFVFDVITAEGVCASGIQSDNDFICRETHGLKSLEYGPAGGGGINPAGNTDPFGRASTTQATACCGPNVPAAGPDGSVAALSTDWVQVAWKRVQGDPYWICSWPFLGVGNQGTSQKHLCGIYKTWGYIGLEGFGGSYHPPSLLGSPPPDFWTHIKMGADPSGNIQRMMAWESHLGLTGETRTGSAGFSGGGVSVELHDDCCYNCESVRTELCPCPHNVHPLVVEYLFDEFIVCAGNRVRILDLPLGWRVGIGGTGPHVSAGSSFWPVAIVGDGSDDQYIDFGAFAFPADTMYLEDASGNILEEWDVPTGIWGGDEYRILSGILGAAGVGARLTGTFEGTDGTGYIAYIDANDGLKLDKWSAAGGLVNLDTVAFPVVTGVYYNVVLEATGSTIRAKAWAGGAGLQGDPENNDPLTWAISEVDATYATGSPGLVGLTSQPVDFDAFAAGLGGDPYPTGRYPGACAWVNPVEGVVFDTGDSPVLLEWTPPPVTAGVLGGELVYELQYQGAGEPGWAPLASNIRTTTYSWDLSTFTAGYYCVQVRAYAGCEYGPWTNVCFQWLGGVSKVPEGYFFGDWYTGEADVGMWIRLFQASHMDDNLPVPGCLVTRELMPAGVGGECLFQKLYVTTTSSTVGTLRVTPILDGDYLIEEQRYITIGGFDPDDDPYDPATLPPSGVVTRRYEIDLTRGFGDPELWRYGYRGSYWQVEICATDHAGTGRIEIDGVFMRYTVVRETHAWARPFIGELEVDVEHETLARFFYGTSTEDADASIWRAEQGTGDFGERLRLLLEPNKYAPFGTGNEGWFRSLYLNFTRTNTSDMTLDVVPILDGVALETTSVLLPATDGQPVTDIHEVPLSVPATVNDIEVGRNGARGVWFAYRIASSGDLASGEITFNGAALEAIPVRETEPGVL